MLPRPVPTAGRQRARAIVLAAFVLIVAACAGTPSSNTPATGAPTGSSAITIDDPWVRPPLGPDRPAAGYLVIRNTGSGDDALVRASTDVAATVEIHETSADASGMMAMHPVHRIAIPAGGSITLEPGGYHLMLLEPDALEPGATVELELEFEHAGTITVTAQVRDAAG